MIAAGVGRWMYYGRLVQALAARDISALFKNAALGIAWVILRPTLFMLVFSVLRGIIKLPSDGLPYPLMSFTGVAAWFLFASILQRATPSIETNAGILKKMAVPRILFPISATGVSLFEYAFTMIPLAGLMLFYQWPAHWTWIFVPLLVCLVVLFGLGLGMLIASFAVYKNDLVLALPYALQIGLFLSAVIYPASAIPAEYQWLAQLNPMVGLIEAFRDVMLRGAPPDWASLTPLFIALAVTWILALPTFRYMSRYFSDAL